MFSEPFFSCQICDLQSHPLTTTAAVRVNKYYVLLPTLGKSTRFDKEKTNSKIKMVLQLSFACWDYDRMKAIEDGRVRPEGIELTFLNYRVEET